MRGELPSLDVSTAARAVSSLAARLYLAERLIPESELALRIARVMAERDMSLAEAAVAVDAELFPSALNLAADGEAQIPAEADYRDATVPDRSCATCSYYGAGTSMRCGMFDTLVSPEMVCDEWAEGLPGALPDQWQWDDLDAVTPPLVAAAPDMTALSTMVAVKPRPDEAEALADPDGDPPETLHVTLAYLGEYDGDLQQIADALRLVAASHAPLEGTVAGYGTFAGAEGAPWPAILLPDVPGLVELRVAVTQALVASEIDYSRAHGFAAHVTLKYVDEPPVSDAGGPFRLDQAGAPLHFDELLIVRSDDELVALPLTGAKPLTAALVAAGEPFCLPSELRGVTDPIRQEFVRTVMTPALEEAGLSWDVTNPLAADVISRAGSHVVGISQTTQDDLMNVVNAAHENGLSIPDTAKAIRAHMSEASSVRATTIARTELAAAANGGSLAAAKIVSQATGAKGSKTWLTAPGATYPRHEEYDGLDGQTVGLDDLFDVGGNPFAFPGDPDGAPEDSINCRCTLTYAGGSGDLSNATDSIDASAALSLFELHNRVLKAAYRRVDAMEPKLAAALQPILERAGEVAARRFESLATNHLTAANDPSNPAGWTPPAAEEILPIDCEAAGLPGAPVEETATQIAARMVADAKAAEPATTEALSAIASDASGKMAGLEFAVKTQASLEDKIGRDLADALAAGETRTAVAVADEINDALRYTITFPASRYGQGVEDALARLKADGYQVVKLKNYWGNADDAGINGVFEKDGRRFELQFHTPKTFELKTKLHGQYEAFRESTDDAERARLWDEMAAEYANVAPPDGSFGIGEQVTHVAPPGASTFGPTPPAS